MREITSPKNPYIQKIAALRENKNLRKSSVFCVEGQREIQRALQSGWMIKDFFFDGEHIRDPDFLTHIPKSAQIWRVSSAAFQKLAMRNHSDGVFGVFERKYWDLSLFDDERQKPLLLCVLCGVEKPGNLGALLRSADGAGVHGFILLDQSQNIDPLSPQVIRASLGTVFSMPVVSMSEDELIKFCQDKGIQLFASACSAQAQSYELQNYNLSMGFVLGGEAFGIPPSLLSRLPGVTIPMKGLADSLNVSVAGAILFYEAVRQRSRLPRE